MWKTFSYGTVKKTVFCLFISRLCDFFFSFSPEVCFPSWTEKQTSSLLDKQKVVGFCHDSWMELLRARREENPLLVQRFPVANAGVTEPNRTFRLHPPLLRNSKGGQLHTWRKLWKVHLHANVLWHMGATTSHTGLTQETEARLFSSLLPVWFIGSVLEKTRPLTFWTMNAEVIP